MLFHSQPRMKFMDITKCKVYVLAWNPKHSTKASWLSRETGISSDFLNYPLILKQLIWISTRIIAWGYAEQICGDFAGETKAVTVNMKLTCYTSPPLGRSVINTGIN